MTADRTRDKMYQRAQKGLWNGGHAPYGYRAENKRLVINTEEAVRVRFMFNRFADAPSLARLREELRQRGWDTRSNGRWSKTAIDQMLRNPIYCGLVRFNEERFKGEHEVLIEESPFNKLQSVRRDRSHGATKLSRVFLLEGLVHCSECDSWMTPHYTQKKHKDGSVYRLPYYRCTKTMHFDDSVCTVKHVNANHVESLVVQKLSELSQNEAYLKMTVEELNRDLKRKVEPLEKEAGRINKRLEEIEQEIGSYVKALGQGKISIGRLETEISGLEVDKRSLQKEQDNLERRINESASRDFNAELLQRTLKDFQATFTELTPREQSEALQRVLKEVIVHRSKLQMEVFELEEFHPSSQNRKVWLRGLDSNQDNQLQRLACYQLHYPGPEPKSVAEKANSAQRFHSRVSARLRRCRKEVLLRGWGREPCRLTRDHAGGIF
jgi:site-specific DNA recombinase